MCQDEESLFLRKHVARGKQKGLYANQSIILLFLGNDNVSGIRHVNDDKGGKVK